MIKGQPNYAHPATQLRLRSVGLVTLDGPTVLEATLIFHPQPIPLCSGRSVPAWGTSLPFPVWRHAAVNIRPTPLVGVLK